MKIKDFGQVFTPRNIVIDILNASDYRGKKILNKNVIDNSCGNGAFLVTIVERYIEEYIKHHKSLKGIDKHLEKYIHGIEMDKDIYQECIENLNKFISKYNIGKIKWDILNEDTLKVGNYNGKMDFVIGNPPYVRVHNLDNQYNNVKEYSFCLNGMTDLYIVFYEIGLRMLNKNGILCYITPNSFYNSLAGSQLRKYIKENRCMELIMDLGHYQPFSVITYTTICKIHKSKTFDNCKYYKYDLKTGIPKYICSISYNDLFIDNNIVLSENNQKYFKYLNYKISKNSKVQVKNGFATLNDKVFIQERFDLKNNIIKVIKASTGQWKECIFPYDKNGKVLKFEELGQDTQKYLLKNKERLIKFGSRTDSNWYAFGRSQAIHDVFKEKIAINTIIKDIDSIKINRVKSGEGVYSGLYMLTSIPFDIINEKICSEGFIEYLRVLNKCKNDGYFAFSSKDLSKYINCVIEEKDSD
ncbi:MAG: N-6 DNA methylase [Caldisericia bacterium]|nr:N-6 DNA methylase [Caldisericia bacterium]